MSYTKQAWTDNVTPVDAAKMNYIESGIFSASLYYGTTPPATPADGDLWVLPADTTSGVMWTFRYRAASGSAYKWEFVGGPPLYSEVQVSEGTISATFAALTTAGPAVTLPRAGDYDLTVQCNISGAVDQKRGIMSYDIGATAAVDADGVLGTNFGTTGFTAGNLCRTNRVSGLTAVTLTAKYRVVDAVSINFHRRRLIATPVRVS